LTQERLSFTPTHPLLAQVTVVLPLAHHSVSGIQTERRKMMIFCSLLMTFEARCKTRGTTNKGAKSRKRSHTGLSIYHKGLDVYFGVVVGAINNHSSKIVLEKC